MKKARNFKLAIYITIIGLLLTSCTSINHEHHSITKQELIIAVGSEPDNGFDPTTGWGSYGTPLFQSTLLKRDSELNIVYDLAESYSISNDGKVWTFDIRRDVTFTDGERLTAHDVKFTFDTTKHSASIVDLSNLEFVEVVEDYKVVFTLKAPQSTFIGLLATLGIVPKHAYGEAYSGNPIGSGPFKFVQWDRGQQVIVEANPDYYGAEPFFKRLSFLFLNEDAAFAAAKSGEVDIATIPSTFSKKIPSGMRLERLQTVDNRGIVFPYVASGRLTEDGYPIGNDVTSDIAIRKAINVAVDRMALVEGIFEGFAAPAYSASDNLPWWHSNTVFEDADLDKAQAILADGGWHDVDEAGILKKGELTAEFTLIYPSNDVIRQSLALAVSDMLKPLGIRIIAEGKGWSDISKLMHSHAVLFGFGSHDPLEIYNIYSSKQMGIDYNNPGFYSNPVVDDWLDKALLATSDEEAWDYWKKAQWDGQTGLSYQGDAPWAWLVNIDHLYIIRENLNIGTPKIQPHGHGWPIIDNIAEWYWEQ